MRRIVTPVFALGLALGAARASSAEPVGSLTQLPRPDACTQLGGDGINCRDGVGLDGPTDVAVSRDGKSVYVTSYVSNALAVFARDPATGALTQLAAPEGCLAHLGDGITCQDAIGLFGAGAVAVSPDNEHVYVASGTSAAIAVFARDTTTGALTQLPEPDGCISQFGGGGSGCTDAYGPIAPTSVLVSPDGKHVLTLALNAGAIGVFARDAGTGKLTQLAAPEGCIVENGDGVTCKSAIALASPRSLALSKNGKHLYVASQNGDAILVFRRNKNTGVLTQLAAPNGCLAENGDGVTCTDAVGLHAATSVLVDRKGRQVYATGYTSDALTTFERDPATGVLTQLLAPDGCLEEAGDGVVCTDAIGLNGARSVAQSNNGKHIYVASTLSSGVAAFRRDKVTGALTQLDAPHGCSTSTGDGVTCRAGLGLSLARAIAVTKNGKHVYVASYGADAVAVFARKK